MIRYFVTAVLIFTSINLNDARAQTPPPKDIMPSGAIYSAHRNPVYIDFSRRSGQRSTPLSGYIDRYTVADERTTDFPSASVWFVPADGSGGILVNLAYPLTINGTSFECRSNTSSQFVERFHVCPSLPDSVMGAQHRVTLSTYPVKYPDGYAGIGTDTITSRQ